MLIRSIETHRRRDFPLLTNRFAMKTLLAVDDEPPNLQLIQMAVEASGLDIEPAEGGPKAAHRITPRRGTFNSGRIPLGIRTRVDAA